MRKPSNLHPVMEQALAPFAPKAAPPSVKTHYAPPPIPLRNFDWSATLDGYEPGDPIGHGATEATAIADLQEQLAGE
jgi:hypothetical protein